MATFVNTATTSPANTTAATAATMPSGVQVGHLLLLWVAGKYRTAVVPTPSGWTSITGKIQHSLTTTGTDSGNTFAYLFARIATGSGDQPTVPAPTSTVNSWEFIVEAWAPDSGKTFPTPSAANIPHIIIDDAVTASPLGGTAGSSMATQPAAADGPQLSAFAVTPTDGGTAFNGTAVLSHPGLSGGTVSNRAYVAVPLGADSAAASWTWTGWTGTATGAPTATVALTGSTNHVGSVLVLWPKEQSSGGTTYAATGDVAATTAATGAPTALLPTTGTVAATTTATGAPTALLPTTGAVAAATAATGDATVVPAGPVQYPATGAVAATTTAAGAPAARLVATGTVAATTTATGAPTGRLPATGAVVATTTATGAPTGRLPATGAVAATTTATGAPTARLVTTATVAAVSTVTGNAGTIGGPQQFPATGTVPATTTATGAPTKRTPTTGQVSGVSSATGTPTKLTAATGAVAATTTTTGTVTVRLAATGTVTATTTTVGQVAALLAALGDVGALVGLSGSVTLVPGEGSYVDVVVALTVDLLSLDVGAGTLTPTAAVELLTPDALEVTL
jgi:hypothetical protein